MFTLKQLTDRFPGIKWNEPAQVRMIGDEKRRYACRICVASEGLKGSDIPSLSDNEAEVRQHLAEVHGA